MTNIHDERHFELTVNGERHEVVDVYPGESLLTVLRDRLGLTGAKGACEEVSVVHVQFFSMATSCAPAWCSLRPQPSRRL